MADVRMKLVTSDGSPPPGGHYENCTQASRDVPSLPVRARTCGEHSPAIKVADIDEKTQKNIISEKIQTDRQPRAEGLCQPSV